MNVAKRHSETAETPSRWVRIVTPVLGATLLGLSNVSHAQTLGYDPYGSGYSQNGPQGGQYGAGQGSGTGANAPMYGAPAGAGSYTPGGGAMQSGVAAGGYTPVIIPSPNDQSQLNEQPPVQLKASPDAESAPGPLYARPGAMPGQFELFQRPPPQTNEFEKFVKQSVGRPLARFGSTLVLTRARTFALPPTSTVPPDYALNPGDELIVNVTGSVEANLRLTIDGEGRIFVPRIGAVNVAGVKYGDLAAALSRRFDEQFKRAKVSVVIGHLHSLTIYVTGYAVSPGAYTVSSLSTMANAVLAAGGPAASGSYRAIRLRRGAELVSTLDLYALLLNGDRGHDAVLQNGDVLDIGPAGPELAVTGSVNAEAIFEAKPGETLGDMIRYAGGLSSLADQSRVVVTRLADLDGEGARQLSFEKAVSFPAERGDIVRILSLGEVARPQERQAVLATIEGEVDRPGRYFLKPGATMGDLLTQAGGLTSGAFPFAVEIDRDSVRRQQEVTYNRAIDDLELAASVAPLSARGSSSTADNAAADTARLQASLAAIERLRQRKPDGRLVLNLPVQATALPPAIKLENNDRVFVPPQPKTVGVFGAVYRPGSFQYGDAPRVGDYLKLAGGPQHYADRGEIYVVHANGAVQSLRDHHGLANQAALPGDLIFVQVRTSPSAWQRFLDLSAVVYQFGVSALTFKALGL